MDSISNRPALRYFGGKWLLAPWIIGYFPRHVCYVEPFGGAASVLLQKQRSFVEVYNDLNKRVVNFFSVLRERPDDLIRALMLTPFSRFEFERALVASPDSLEDARRLAIIAGQGNRGAGTVNAGGWRWMKNPTRAQTPAHEFYKIGHLSTIADRFRSVQIENDDALSVIQRYDSPTTLFYVDPPYVLDTRHFQGGNDAYEHEMYDTDQSELSEMLHQVQGMVIVSGYPSDLYDRLYSSWTMKSINHTRHVRRWRGRGQPVVECLWMSPNCKSIQASMF